jgi:hypothetical protein
MAAKSVLQPSYRYIKVVSLSSPSCGIYRLIDNTRNFGRQLQPFSCATRRLPSSSHHSHSIGQTRRLRFECLPDHQSTTSLTLSSSDRYPINVNTYTMAQAIKAMHSQPVRPNSPAPLAEDFARQQIAKQQRSNFHSSSLRRINSSNMVADNVNKTALHPGGVQ